MCFYHSASFPPFCIPPPCFFLTLGVLLLCPTVPPHTHTCPQDFTVLMLIAAGVLSLVLTNVVPGSDSSDFVEGCAILLSVVIVVSVSAITNYQKECKFCELNTLKDDVKV